MYGVIENIYDGGTFEWFCHTKSCPFHYEPLLANVEHSTVRYVTLNPENNFGATISLPSCICGARAFIKADYTMEDLQDGKVIVDLPETYGGGKIMKIHHANNILMHHLLYLLKKAPCPPLLSLPPSALLQNLSGTSLSMACSVWFTYQIEKNNTMQIPGISLPLLG